MSENQTQNAAETAAPATGQSAKLTEGRGGYIGIKAGMTQVFNDKGEMLAVTVIDLAPNVVTQVRTQEKDGYKAVQVGVHAKKAGRGSKALQGHSKKSGGTVFAHYQEIRMPANAKMDGVAPGATLTADFIQPGDLIDLTSISKGKGFQGVMKRYNFAGGFASHGASVCHRSLGSIGNRADPARVFKNKKMAGQMGAEKVTVQNVKVVRVDLENGVLLVHGSVPGPKSGYVTIRKAIKNAS